MLPPLLLPLSPLPLLLSQPSPLLLVLLLPLLLPLPTPWSPAPAESLLPGLLLALLAWLSLLLSLLCRSGYRRPP